MIEMLQLKQKSENANRLFCNRATIGNADFFFFSNIVIEKLEFKPATFSTSKVMTGKFFIYKAVWNCDILPQLIFQFLNTIPRNIIHIYFSWYSENWKTNSLTFLMKSWKTVQSQNYDSPMTALIAIIMIFAPQTQRRILNQFSTILLNLTIILAWHLCYHYKYEILNF